MSSTLSIYKYVLHVLPCTNASTRVMTNNGRAGEPRSTRSTVSRTCVRKQHRFLFAFGSTRPAPPSHVSGPCQLCPGGVLPILLLLRLVPFWRRLNARLPCLIGRERGKNRTVNQTAARGISSVAVRYVPKRILRNSNVDGDRETQDVFA